MTKTLTFDDLKDSGKNFLSKIFAPITLFIDEYNEAIERCAQTDADLKMQEIDWLLLNTAIDNDISSAKALKTAIEKVINAASNQNKLYYGITANDLFDRYANLSNESSKILQSAHKSDDWNVDDWQNLKKEFENQRDIEEREKYLNSYKFQADRERQLDHLLNYKLGEELSTMTENELVEYLEEELQTNGMQEFYHITVEDVINYYAESGQVQHRLKDAPEF